MYVQSKEGAAPARIYTPDDIATIRHALAASVRSVANMAYGLPTESTNECIKLLLRTLKTGSAGGKTAACMMLQFMAAVPATRAALWRAQAVPLLVSACATGAFQPETRFFSLPFDCLLHLQVCMRMCRLQSSRIACPSTCGASPQGVCLVTLYAQKHIFLLAIALQLTAALAAGVPEAKRAAAEALTNMAATARIPPLATSNIESKKQDRGSADGESASDDPPATRTSMSKRSSNGGENNNANAKIDVQRAGAVAPLMAMLKLSDQRCVQAAATALYVLAAEDENRAAMAQAGVRLALQEARHFLVLLILFSSSYVLFSSCLLQHTSLM